MTNDINFELSDFERRVRDVRDIYGVAAAELVADGWTVDGAIAHVRSECDQTICTGEHIDGKSVVETESRTEFAVMYRGTQDIAATSAADARSYVERAVAHGHDASAYAVVRRVVKVERTSWTPVEQGRI